MMQANPKWHVTSLPSDHVLQGPGSCLEASHAKAEHCCPFVLFPKKMSWSKPMV